MASTGITFTPQCLEVVSYFKVEKGYTQTQWYRDRMVFW